MAKPPSMERTHDKTNVKQESVKREEAKKGVKHEGARETRPDRPIADKSVDKPLQKRDEEQDKQVPAPKRDEEKVKADFDADYGAKNKDEAEAEVGAGDAPDMAETESGNVVKTKRDDEEAPSQGV